MQEGGQSSESHGASSGTQPAGEIAHAAARGAVGAMAMSGVRAFTVQVGLLDESPPTAIVRQKTRGLLRMVPKGKRRALVELSHWSYGAVGGVGFALLPDSLRRRAWAGPIYGLATWLAFELGVAPALGLAQSKRPRPTEWVVVAADHLVYGLVLSEGRRRPQE